MPGDGDGWKRFATQQLPRPAKAAVGASASASAFARSVLRKGEQLRRAPAPAPPQEPPDAAGQLPRAAGATTSPHERYGDTYTLAAGRQAAATLAVYDGVASDEPAHKAAAVGQEAAAATSPEVQLLKAAQRKRPSLLGLFGGAAPNSGGVAAAQPAPGTTSPVASSQKARRGSGGRWQPPYTSTSQQLPTAGTGSEAATPEDERMRRARSVAAPPHAVLRMRQDQDDSSHLGRMRQDQDNSSHLARMRQDHDDSSHLARMRQDHDDSSHLARMRQGHDDSSHLARMRHDQDVSSHVGRMRQDQDVSSHVVRMRQDQNDSCHVARMRQGQGDSSPIGGCSYNNNNNNNNNNSRVTQRPRYFDHMTGYNFSIPSEPAPLPKYEDRHPLVELMDFQLHTRDTPPAPAAAPTVEDRETMDVDKDNEDDSSVDLSSEQAEGPSSGLANRQGSLELDESLGILTPDQMKEPFSSLLDPAPAGAAFFCGSVGAPGGVGDIGGAGGRRVENSVQRMNALCREVVYVDQFSFPEYDSIMDTVEESASSLAARPRASPLPVSPCSGDASAAGDADATEHTLSPEELPVDTPVREEAALLEDDDTKTEDASDNTLLTASSSAEPSSSRSSVAVAPPPALQMPPPPAAPQQALAAPAPGAAPAAHCFITSVTSITSLDTGYQGDGESSRPASRGAELSSPPGPAPQPQPPASAAHALALAQQDPMTDSDFFTESDADGHEEARAPPPAAAPAAHEEPPSSSSSSAAAGCGDRRAQVIDGTLYNESQRLQQRCPSFTASSEMESSGVFSDLEPRRPEDGDADVDADDASAAHDTSPSGSTRTVSEHSQEKEIQSPTGSNVTASTTVILEESSLEEAERALTEENNLKNMSSPVITELGPPPPAQGQGQGDAAPQEQAKKQPGGGPKVAAGDGKPRELKKFKMPKRNVVSKIKAMIEAPAPHEDQENQRPLHKPKKGGRWDDVMNKIAQGQAEQRVLKTHLKEVKSKVFAGLTHSPPPDSTTGRKKAGTPTSTAVAALERTGSADSTTPTRTKSRRTRTRASPISQSQHGHQHLPLSGHSSVRSSVSDVSGEHVSPATPSCKSVSSLRSAKKRADTTRANSPLSDGSLNSSTSHQPARRQNQQKNGVPDMKTPVARKPASRRSAPVTTAAKPQPLRDHNRVAGSGAPPKEPAGKLQPQLQPANAVPTRAQLQQLRHSATGFEAFAVLLQYLVSDTEQKQCQYEDEISRLERLHSTREAALLEDGMSKLQQAEAEHKRQLRESEQRAEELRERLAEADAETSRLQQQVEDLISRDHDAQLQTEQTRCRYEGEISRLERLHTEREAALLEDSVARLQQAEAEHKRRLRESEQRAEELRARLEAADAETSHLQQQVAGLVSGLRQDRDAQLQVTAGRCHDLEEEVRSLRTVLDLRHEELAEVRRQNAELAKDAGELPGALQRIATLQARVEDLQEQLQHKANFERQLSQENRKLNESFHHVAVQKQRLSQHNEELQWKLKQSTEAVHVITQALSSTPLSHNNHKSGQKLIDSFHDYSQTFPEISKSYTKLSSRSPLMQRRNDISRSPLMDHDLEHPSPPASPIVKAVVEKSDSVSWVLDMDESPEAKVSRLVRRAGSFRGSSGLSPPSTAQSQTLPRSRGASGPGNRRSAGTSAGRPRTRAWSVSSSDNFVSCWGSPGTCATSTPVTMQRSMSVTQSPAAHSYGEENYKTSPGKAPLKRCSGDPQEFSVNGDEDDDDDMRIHHNANGSGAKRSNADSGPSSLDGHVLSLRTCGSSNSSSASPPGSNTCSSTSSCSEAEHNYRHLNGSIIYRQVETETADMRVVPIPHLSGSSDLSILAAACAAAKPLMGAPKDAAGEAMISEETLDNENDDGDEGDTSSDGEDPQSWGNVGLLPSDSEA